ncbi:MAG: hypothetical protein LLF76_00990 [Planctomycetaceae bacterium]|nr:hypothetical protein [Planctomycetaceae bacterium]
MNLERKTILDRYPRASDGTIIVDIAAGKIEDIFNNFDKATPYAKKDLDTDFFTYLVDSVKEIGNVPFLIEITLDIKPDDARWRNAIEGIRNYFIYIKELKIRELKMLYRTSLIMLAVGVVVMMLSIWAHRTFGPDPDMFTYVFAEGLTVTAWILMWESLAGFLIQWPPYRRDIRCYKRIAHAAITCRCPLPDTLTDQPPRP